MLNKKIQYSGNDLFKIKNNSHFGLYTYEDLNFNETKDEVLQNFKENFESNLKKVLKKIGLKYSGLIYYSPKYYNYDNDSVDLNLRVINKNLFKKYILKFKKEIDLNLNKNNSYDGYTALTISNYKSEIENLNNSNYEPDILILKTILNSLIDFSNFNICDYMVYEGID